jgi:pimeloyl-ACP methyl ester carboxylesterase
MIGRGRAGGIGQRWLLAWCLLLGFPLLASPAPPFPFPRLTNSSKENDRARPQPTASNRFDPVAAELIQIVPSTNSGSPFQRSPGQNRAIILLHGFHVLPFHKAYANQAVFHSWQKFGSKLVQELTRQGDIYAFAYSQNVAIEEIAGVPDLADNIRKLQMLGYAQIVLLGHSAGGLIARQFVEDYPESGVTKVIQVCSPNGGTNYAHLQPAVSSLQRGFLHSLSKETRSKSLKVRAEIKIPAAVQFICVVGDGGGLGDGLLSLESQWPSDLQNQGIPAIFLHTTHFTVMRSESSARRLAELVRSNLPRWDPVQVARVRKEKLRKKDETSRQG